MAAFNKIVKHEMDGESSLDLETSFDWIIAEQVKTSS